ncbi:MAG: hypothetical protein QW476_02145 [Candidatus Bathyarchaeia archaeon]
MNNKFNRRKCLVLVGGAVGVYVAYTFVDYYKSLTPYCKFLKNFFQRKTPALNQTTTITTPIPVNPVVEYALEKGVNPEVAERLGVINDFQEMREDEILDLSWWLSSSHKILRCKR